VKPARMLYGADVPVAALCYVWDTKAAPGTFAPSAYTDRVRMIVVDSGARNLGRWMRYERNVADDFRTAFGGEAPAIRGTIVSTDTDNTGGRPPRSTTATSSFARADRAAALRARRIFSAARRRVPRSGDIRGRWGGSGRT
jgi:DUF3047 family protein